MQYNVFISSGIIISNWFAGAIVYNRQSIEELSCYTTTITIRLLFAGM